MEPTQRKKSARFERMTQKCKEPDDKSTNPRTTLLSERELSTFDGAYSALIGRSCSRTWSKPAQKTRKRLCRYLMLSSRSLLASLVEILGAGGFLFRLAPTTAASPRDKGARKLRLGGTRGAENMKVHYEQNAWRGTYNIKEKIRTPLTGPDIYVDIKW